MLKGEKPFDYKWQSSSIKQARYGFIKTPRGIIETPSFFFCATRGVIKTLESADLKEMDLPLLVCNTYHLSIEPGTKTIADLGGLHCFMNWDRPIFTDSGGYQIFSMGYGSVSSEIKGIRQGVQSSLLKVDDDGVLFRSYKDGQIFRIRPEDSIRMQGDLGADLIVQFDECTPYHFTYEETKRSLARSISWGRRSLKEYTRSLSSSKQALYGVLQGGIYEDLRIESTKEILSQDFFGMAIGGSLGSSQEEMESTLELVCPLINKQDRPIHLLGIGTIDFIFKAIEKGIDSFDCVYPTRLARHGGVIVPGEKRSRIHIGRSLYKNDHRELDPDYPTTGYTRAYIHHLWKSKELTALSLITKHNIMEMQRMMKSIRIHLQRGDSKKWESLKGFWIKE